MRDAVSEFRPLGWKGKTGLALEILREYVPARRILRTVNVVDMVAAARGVPATRAGSPPDLEYQTAMRLGRAVQRTLKLLPTDSRCLIQSLVLTRLLARRSIPNVLVIGVRQGSGFEAHAWIEHGGRPVLPAGSYQRLAEF